MKKAIMILALVPSIALGSLIDLTPGGFNVLNPPPVYVDWRDNHFNHDSFGTAFYTTGLGWDRHFLGSPLFELTLADSGRVATLSWNLTGTPYSFTFLFVGTGPDGTLNMYRVSDDQLRVGEAIVTINDFYPITALGIYGLRPPVLSVPDFSSTIGLFLIGLVSLYAFNYRSKEAK
jgi:hypothetical protein